MIRNRFPEFSFRTLVELLVATLFGIAITVLCVAVFGLTSAVHAEKTQSATRAAAQSVAINKLQGQAGDLGVALKNAATVLERRSPTYSFFVCWSAHVGDLFNSLPALNKNATPEQLSVFGQIAANTRKALTPIADGGCLDPSIPVDVPAPVTIPGTSPPSDPPPATASPSAAKVPQSNGFTG